MSVVVLSSDICLSWSLRWRLGDCEDWNSHSAWRQLSTQFSILNPQSLWHVEVAPHTGN